MTSRTVPTTEPHIICPICRAPNRPDARFCQQCGNDVLLDGIYRITKIIKSGGMGIVYKALDASGTEYAVKEMHDKFAAQSERDEGIMRFVEEAKLLRDLDHPAIPKVYRSFIDEGRYYLSMEFVHGEDLEDMLKREKRFSEPTVLRWADQLCDVLEYMHGAGLIYRDMKPSNVMIDRDKQVKVVDFGIAKLLEPGQRNTMVGTPGYSPPEQYQGLATVQSDVYALGATLHHLLTGRDPREHPPFSFPFAQTLNRGVSMRTAKAIDKALQMEVADRYHSIEEFRRALPIPTGERQRTRTFDPQRTRTFDPRDVEEPRTTPQPQRARPEAQPQRSRTAPQPRQQPQPRPSAAPRQAPQPSVAAPPTQPPRRRRGRAIRNVVVATLLAAGLAGAGTVVVPEVLPAIREWITQPAPAPAPAAPTFVLQQWSTEVSVNLPDGTGDAAIRDALRAAYPDAAKAQFPGAEVTLNRPPAVQGSITPSETVDASGNRTYTATVSGWLNVPQSP